MDNIPYDINDVCGEFSGQEGKLDTWFDNEMALGLLLLGGVVFCNQRKYQEIDGIVKDSTTVIFMLCNDVFMWGCADGEALLNYEIESLFRMWHADKQWGPVRWVCIKRQEKPQGPIVRDMKIAGAWDEVMEALPENYVDKHNRLKREAVQNAD